MGIRYVEGHFHGIRSDGDTDESKIVLPSDDNTYFLTLTDHDYSSRLSLLHPNILPICGVEASAYTLVHGVRRSVHTILYRGHTFSTDLESAFVGVRTGKLLKIQYQCEAISHLGIQVNFVPFDFEYLQSAYPQNPGNYNTSHLLYLLRGRALAQLKDQLGMSPGQGIMHDVLKQGGIYHSRIFPDWQERVPSYELGLDTIREMIDDKTIHAIAHPHISFRSIDEFREWLTSEESRYLNAIEISATMPREWVEFINDFIAHNNRYHKTYGSDNHRFNAQETRIHGAFGQINQHILLEGVHADTAKMIDFMLS